MTTMPLLSLPRAGPKNYGYRTKNGKVECKVRSFCLNTRGQTQLNFEALKQNDINEIPAPQQQ